jgi:hypothetical protein
LVDMASLEGKLSIEMTSSGLHASRFTLLPSLAEAELRLKTDDGEAERTAESSNLGGRDTDDEGDVG